MRDRVVDGEVVVCDIREDAALDPLVQAEGMEVRSSFWLALSSRQRAQLVPLAPVRQLGLELRALNVREEFIHAAREEGNVVLVESRADDVSRMRTNRAAHVDRAADHADAGALTEHRVEISAVVAADDGLATAHELERERADILEDPELRLLVERVMLHQRARARAAAAADEDLAARRAVAGRIAGIALDGDDAAGVEPADISRRRLLDDDLRARQAHRARALAGVPDVEMQLLAFRMPERTADVVLAGGLDLKVRLALLDGFADGQEQVLGGHAFMPFHGIYLKH